MSMITINEAAKILGVSKRTLMRWDKQGKFPPASRESPLKIRVYKKSDVEGLKTLLEHQKRFRKNLSRLFKIQESIGLYKCSVWESRRQEDLKMNEKKLRKERDSLIKEFDNFRENSPKMWRLYQKFFKQK